VSLATVMGLLAPRVQAQAQNQLGALTTFVNAPNNNATPGQRQVAYAVQGMCNFLVNEGYSAVRGQTTAPVGKSVQSSEGDLFLRCNELARTASQLNSNGTPPATGRSLNYSDPASLLGALQQVNGEEVATQGSLATQVPAGQFANIGSRLSSLRYGSFNSAMRGRASALNWEAPGGGDSYHYASDNFNAGYFTRDGGEARLMHTSMGGGDVTPSASPAAREQSAVSNPWGLFTEGTYNFGNRDATGAADGYDFKARSVTAGVDYNFGSAVAGISIGYDNYKADLRSSGNSVSGGDARVKGTSGSLFAAWFGERWTFNGIASFGTLKTDITRIATYASLNPGCTPTCGVTNRTFTGDPSGHDTAVGATAGYDVNVGAWSLSPTLSLNYRKVKIDDYSENEFNAPVGGGGLALRYGSQDIDSLRSVLGISVTRPFSESFGVISPNFKAEWQHEYKDESRTVDASYVFDLSPTQVSRFPIQTDAAAKNFGIIGVGLTALFSNRLQAYVTYERLVGVSYLTSNSITLGLRGQL